MTTQEPEAVPQRRPWTVGRVAVGVAVVLFLVGAAVANQLVTREPPEQRPVALEGNRTAQPALQIAPERRAAPVRLTGTGLDGEPIDTADWTGRVVVVNVWGSWCAPCRREAPSFAAAARDYRPAGVQFLGLDVDDNAASARAFEKRFGITYPSIEDDGTAVLAFRGSVPPAAVPSTVVLDRQGRVAARVIGATGAVTLRTLVDDTLKESAPDENASG